MNKRNFTLSHVNATEDDLVGNNGIGRYILLPGSDGRAKDISQHFNNLSVKQHPRGHNLYLGTLPTDNKVIDVAVIASGMGCPNMEIVLHELLQLGGKRFLRVGTAGSLQPQLVHVGDMVQVNASVRDESTTSDYVPTGMPAIASVEFSNAILSAANKLSLTDRVKSGVVHCKRSLYAREFGVGPKHTENLDYMQLLTQCGVLATEMETSALFILSQLHNYQLMLQGSGPKYRVICGAILGILGTLPDQFLTYEQEAELSEKMIMLALEAVRELARTEI